MGYKNNLQQLQTTVRRVLSIDLKELQKGETYYLLMLAGNYNEKMPMSFKRLYNKYQKVIYHGYYGKHDWYIFKNYRTKSLKLKPEAYRSYWFLYPKTIGRKVIKNLYKD